MSGVKELHSFYRPVNGVHVTLVRRSYEQGAEIFPPETTISGALVRKFDDLNGATVISIEYEQVAGTMACDDDLT
tara:strand:+ start:193 stop:417 length:225 start_codon:yes stop_codon:yes gene_type:complete